MTNQTADVFVSYKAEDRARLKPLVAALEAEGFSVWWDAHIGGGVNWRKDIQEHLDSAKCVIVAWTRRSVGEEGEFVRDEATDARRRGVYLPVRLDAVELPLGFREVQALSLKGWHGDRADPRFQAVADAVRSRLTAEHQTHAHTHISQQRISRRTAIAGGAGAVALAGAGGWFLLKPTAANAKRIAVLPFANLSTDQEQAYFSEGVAEELRAALSRIGLEVIGRASSEAVKDLDTEAAASKLRVSNILTGSVRRSPQTIRVNAQLVRGSDGVERWAETYDRAPGDAIKIQSDIAQNVAQALSVTLGQATRAALTLGGTSDSVAQDLVLRAREVRRDGGGPEALRKAVTLADAAVARDPKYADAYVTKADILIALGSNYASGPAEMVELFGLAETAATRAMKIAPDLGSAHVSLAGLDSNRLQFRSALQHARRALALSPDDPYVLTLAAANIIYLEGGHTALQVTDRLIALDPLNSRAYRWKSEALLSIRQYSQAIETGRLAAKLAPSSPGPHIVIAFSLLLLGKPTEALAEFRDVSPDEPFRLVAEGLAAARLGQRAGAERAVGRLRQVGGDTASYQCAQIHAQTGERDRSFAELETAVRTKDPGLIYAKADPFFDPIRGDPRYAALIRKLDFP